MAVLKNGHSDTEILTVDTLSLALSFAANAPNTLKPHCGSARGMYI